ncbi:MAG TPA: hypothetical protein VGN16_15725 [Acidobacteriaceae bacterium]|jgi:methyl-accepting chemotaxis protein
MASANALMMFAWQQYDGEAHHDVHLIMYALVAMAIVMCLLMLGLLVAGILGFVQVRKLIGVLEDTRAKVEPVFEKGVEFFDDVAPKVRSITTNVDQICYTVREKADEVGETVSQVNRTVADINNRTRVQVARVDGMVTEALVTTQEISQTVQRSVRAPLQQIAGIVAGMKAGLEKLIERSPFASPLRKKQSGPGPYDL